MKEADGGRLIITERRKFFAENVERKQLPERS